MSRRQLLRERRRRLAAKVYDHQTELLRVHRWLLTHQRREGTSVRRR